MTACKMYAFLAKYFWVQVFFQMGYFNSLNVWQLLLFFESQIWFPSFLGSCFQISRTSWFSPGPCQPGTCNKGAQLFHGC